MRAASGRARTAPGAIALMLRRGDMPKSLKIVALVSNAQQALVKGDEASHRLSGIDGLQTGGKYFARMRAQLFRRHGSATLSAVRRIGNHRD